MNSEKSRFSAARRTDEYDELSRRDLEVHVAQHFRFAERLRNVHNVELGHLSKPRSFHQPLEPDIAMPSTIFRWKIRKKIRGGSAASRFAVITTSTV